MARKYLIFLSLAGLVVTLDQIAKIAIQLTFRLGESRVIIPNFFNLTYIHNPGAAFGLLSKTPPAFRIPFFILIPLIAFVCIIFIFRRLTGEQMTLITSLALILGGALGNFIDRIRFGYVIDFLDLHWFDRYHWPAFNVADMAICAGVGILIYLTLFTSEKELP